MTIVPLTTPLPVYALEVFGHEVFAPLSWLVAGLAVLVSGRRRQKAHVQDAA